MQQLTNRIAGVALAGVLLAGAACAGEQGAKGDRPVTIIKEDVKSPPTGGLPPDKHQEVLLLLQSRDQTLRKCYQDVLNERQDRSFQGDVELLMQLAPDGQATDVRVIRTTLGSSEVEECLIEKIKGFEFPQLDQPGQVQYTYNFRPAY